MTEAPFICFLTKTMHNRFRFHISKYLVSAPQQMNILYNKSTSLLFLHSIRNNSILSAIELAINNRTNKSGDWHQPLLPKICVFWFRKSWRHIMRHQCANLSFSSIWPKWQICMRVVAFPKPNRSSLYRDICIVVRILLRRLWFETDCPFRAIRSHSFIRCNLFALNDTQLATLPVPFQKL